MTKSKRIPKVGGIVVIILLLLYVLVIYPAFVASTISLEKARTALLGAIKDGQEFEIIWEHQPDRFTTCFDLNSEVVANIDGTEVESSTFQVNASYDSGPNPSIFVNEVTGAICDSPGSVNDTNDA